MYSTYWTVLLTDSYHLLEYCTTALPLTTSSGYEIQSLDQGRDKERSSEL